MTKPKTLTKCIFHANVRENRRGNKSTIQRNWQHWVHKTQDEDKHKIYTTIRKQR